ncbi:hypothetical protein FRC18_001007 [Serendipita sp. 400]|nr:hypothetical protein FRC18_001007 [Serendipita sp. 400]
MHGDRCTESVVIPPPKRHGIGEGGEARDQVVSSLFLPSSSFVLSAWCPLCIPTSTTRLLGEYSWKMRVSIASAVLFVLTVAGPALTAPLPGPVSDIAKREEHRFLHGAEKVAEFIPELKAPEMAFRAFQAITGH